MSDYWGGHHLPHVAIQVDGTTTVREVFDQIESEINQGAFGGSLDWEVQESEEFHKACYAALQEMQELNPGQDVPAFPDLEPFDDSGESVMAYFVFVPIDE